MHQMFFNLDATAFDLDEYSDDRKTWPPPGTTEFVVEEKFEPLFTSAVWIIEMRAGNTVIARSKENDRKHTENFIDIWVRTTIKANYEKLRQLGVDAELEFAEYGGDISDLSR